MKNSFAFMKNNYNIYHEKLKPKNITSLLSWLLPRLNFITEIYLKENKK
jgi:hypothetical protein